MAYIEACGLTDPKAPLFRTIRRDTKRLSQTQLSQPDAHGHGPPPRYGKLPRTQKWRHAGECCRHGQSQLDADDAAP